MTRRPQHRGNRPAGLFADADPATGEVVPEGEVRDNPLTRPCPPPPEGCGAPVAHPCTAGSRYTGRRRIGDYHSARKASGSKPPVLPSSVAASGLNPTPAGGTTGERSPNDRCAIHGHEPIPANCYRVCGECWHAYATADELIEADYAVRLDLAEADGLADLVERRDPDLIHICPLCTHDF